MLEKEGFLYKAGKRSFQSSRKRWFTLGDSYVRYYTPGPVYNENNQLGSIPMTEVEMVALSKGCKHGFDVVTRTRTYYLSAKTDEERDTWIIALRKAQQENRGKTDPDLHNYDTVTLLKKNSKKGSSKKTRTPSKFYCDSQGYSEPADLSSNQPDQPIIYAAEKSDYQEPADAVFSSRNSDEVFSDTTKPRAATFDCLTDTGERSLTTNADAGEGSLTRRRSASLTEPSSGQNRPVERSESEANRQEFVSTMKRKMSRDFQDTVEGLYEELGDELDQCYATEDELDDDEGKNEEHEDCEENIGIKSAGFEEKVGEKTKDCEKISTVESENEDLRGKNTETSYAFDEIRTMLGEMEVECNSADLEEFETIREQETYKSIFMLKNFLNHYSN